MGKLQFVHLTGETGIRTIEKELDALTRVVPPSTPVKIGDVLSRILDFAAIAEDDNARMALVSHGLEGKGLIEVFQNAVNMTVNSLCVGLLRDALAEVIPMKPKEKSNG